MQTLPATITPERWMTQFFSARACAEGGTIRRKTRDIERIVGLDRFLNELKRRGFSAVENADQIIVFCNRQPIRRIL